MWNSNFSSTPSQATSSYRDLYATSSIPLAAQNLFGEKCDKEVGPSDSGITQRPLRFIDSIVKRGNELESPSFLTTGCENIDSFLHGGIPCFGITEIYGAAGSAKTQLCLQLALNAQLPDSLGGLNNSGVVYINTEGAFPVTRMAELVRHFQMKYSVYSQENPMDNIVVESVLDPDALFRCLNVRIPALVDEVGKSRIRLIILDSVAAVFRADFDVGEFQERAVELRKTGAVLHKLAESLRAAVVVVNQETTSLALGQNVPALGLTWTNLVTTRLRLSRVGKDRFLDVNFAPHLPEGSLKIQLTSRGINAEPWASEPPKKPKIQSS